MQKQEVLAKLKEFGVIAVVRAESAAEAVKIARACIAAGIVGIEITYTVPGAEESIREIKKAFEKEGVLVGAGTVLDAPTARNAILAGADFVVSPALNVETVKLCNRYQTAVMPGAMTVKEAVEGMEAGADIIKIFPAHLFGPGIIKAIKGPLPQCEMIPTGGVNAENAAEWIRAGAVAVGAGSELIAGAKTGDYAAITEEGKRMIEVVKQARS
ncbi:MAG: bifunctional 2-keto-4-hydroxyglutarate aldolase/2-keto-3-deoxy-6-phosphogluconate aldolase [Christensenellaceae bacterium]|jgi:2-dehydro-3-deoxyphosphogluconate aldolase/(4S)-4-hydroxy-2-oxoglutarate aldolase